MAMNHKYLISLVVLIFFCASCSKYDEEISYSEEKYVPILMKYDEMTESVKQMPVRSITNPGKIAVFQDYILIVEKFKGFHVINNSNPASPLNVAFFSIPGCVDVAVKNNILYADNAIDLVAINISDKNNMYPVYRIPDVFPELLPPDSDYISHWFTSENRPENTVIVGWRLKDEAI